MLTDTGRCPRHPIASGWEQTQRGSRHERGYGAEWERLRVRILMRDQYLCQPCMRAGRLTALVVGDRMHPRGAQVDHIVPKANDGTDDPDNLEAICRTCHEAKTAGVN